MKNLVLEVIAPDEGQTESWAHLAPFGEYNYTKSDEDGNGVNAVQLLDAETFSLVIKNFKPEVLIDREHLSIRSDDTTAMGWVQELEVRGDGSEPDHGLWARVRWTDVGMDNLKNRRLRWLSPVWPPIERDDNRPVELASVGLTNGARFRKNLKPVVNKADGVTNNKPDTPDGGKEQNMEKLLEMLGVSTAEEAEAKIKALQESAGKVEALNKEVEEMKKGALETEAGKVAEENADRIANKEEFKKLYVENKEAALSALRFMKAPEKKEVVNKQEAQRPSFMTDGAGGGEVANKLEQFNSMEPGAAKDKFFVENKAELLELQQKALKKD